MPMEMDPKVRGAILKVLEAMTYTPVPEGVEPSMLAAKVFAKIAPTVSNDYEVIREGVIDVLGAVRRVYDHDQTCKDIKITSDTAWIEVDDSSYQKIA